MRDGEGHGISALRHGHGHGRSLIIFFAFSLKSSCIVACLQQREPAVAVICHLPRVSKFLQSSHFLLESSHFRISRRIHTELPDRRPTANTTAPRPPPFFPFLAPRIPLSAPQNNPWLPTTKTKAAATTTTPIPQHQHRRPSAYDDIISKDKKQPHSFLFTMANNAGRQGGAGAAGGAGGGGGGNVQNEHVEFTVKAEEDLYLTGSESTIRRVTADTNYSCLMLKTQRFSSLFRHYAKYHGLRKDDLEYYFVHPLENEDTPESVQLQRGDIIMVRKRRKAEVPEPAADDTEFFKDMKELLDDEEHMDAVFLVYRSPPPTTSAAGAGNAKSAMTAPAMGMGMDGIGGAGGGKRRHKKDSGIAIKKEGGIGGEDEEDDDDDDDDLLVEIRAHKCILTARADYFKALFRKGTSSSNTSSTTAAVAGAVLSSTSVASAALAALESPSSSSSSDAAAANVSAAASSAHANNNNNAFRESTECIIRVPPHFSPKVVRLMLEFLYTNRIECASVSLSKLSGSPTASSSANHNANTDELLSLLHLADMWQLRDLKRLVEHELIRNHMKIHTVARMYCATEDFHAKRLSKSCLEFIMDNYREVTGSVAFQEEMKHHPSLCIPVLKAAADLIPEQPVSKKQRVSANEVGKADSNAGGGAGAGAMSSSPVPDSDI